MTTYCIALPDQKSRGFYEETAQEYEKRLRRFCKIQRVGSVNTIGERDYVINISAAGRWISSVEMAGRLSDIESRRGVTRVIFTVRLKRIARTNETWALTSIDPPADLQAVLLLEQIYRARKIIHNEPYHK
jgi:23S rRNA (pseudouridine1915-N3)-methyltransferase